MKLRINNLIWYINNKYIGTKIRECAHELYHNTNKNIINRTALNLYMHELSCYAKFEKIK